MSSTAAAKICDFQDEVAPEISHQEFMVFAVGEKEYAIYPAKAKGLRGYENIIRLRDAPEFLTGVIHYNGLIAPVIDLRLQFDPATRTRDDSVNVLMLNMADRLVGMVVKKVSGLMKISEAQIASTVKMIHTSHADYLIGIAQVDERKIHILNSERLISRIATWFHLDKLGA